MDRASEARNVRRAADAWSRRAAENRGTETAIKRGEVDPLVGVPHPDDAADAYESYAASLRRYANELDRDRRH